MASSSSSHQKIVEQGPLAQKECERSATPPKLYDVFINHRGPDVKETLAFELYSYLQEKGCRTFLDSEKLELGDSIPSTIRDAICSSSVQIAIFSKRYAESAWCLAELVLMLETKAKFIPVFYGVQPWELRHIENGVYAEAFSKNERQGRYLNDLETWKRALFTASSFSGYEFKPHKHNYSSYTQIVSAVQQEVERRKPLDVAKHPVGLDELVEDFESKSGQNGEETKFKIIGIFGMGGSGKTTLAKELFNRRRLKYNGSCFLSDVREASAKGELTTLQTKILKDLVNESHSNFQSIAEGTTYVRSRLESASHSRFFTVLDNIDDLDQLDALLFEDALGSDSLVIVTTRDERVLTRARITVRYSLKKMDRHHAIELFSWHAFNQPNPVNGFEDLVDSFVHLCGGLPLSLKVLGGHVSGSNNMNYWQLVLEKVRKRLPDGIKQTLKISFDALDNEEKQIFLDIACFFIGKSKSMATKILKGSGWSAELALQNLKDKCLVEEGYEVGYAYGEVVLRMHDNLRDLGREIADDLSHPRRLWHPQFLKSLESKGFQTILTETNGRCFHSIFDPSMNCKITYFVEKSNNSADTSTVLLWLELDLKGNELKSIPSWIPLQNLQYLRIVDGCLKKLWQDDLQVSNSSWIPPPILQSSMSTDQGIKKRLFQSGAESSMSTVKKRLFQSDAEVPFKLKELLLETIILRELPNTLGMLNHLENLVLKGKYSYITDSEFLIEGRSFSESLRKLSSLKSLTLWDFRLSGDLALSDSRDATSFQTSIDRSMSCLQTIRIRGVQLTSKLSIDGKNCPSLESLRLDSMENLVEVNLSLVKTLNSLKLMFCRKLKTISGNFGLGNLETLNIKECGELEEVPNLSGLDSLESITIDECQKLQNIKDIEELKGLKFLYLSTGNGGAGVWNCVQRLKRFPSEFTTVIGRAVDEAESILNENFFSSLISPEAVTMHRPMRKNSKREDSVKTPESLSAIIICALVQSSSGGEIKTPITRWRPFAPGERIVTIVLTGRKSVYKDHSPDFNLRLVHAELKQKCIVTVNKGEESKALDIFKTIIAQLYQGIP
ncbi:hypothetical protein KI387_032682 [Taxus chinensis]|uniref:TIR domain-containing protein n=1 Tax=Taxus chinensis TaxID=29808 RepID=A0AA38F4C9_TAXCH|nr:hypothetical protein KI387_032682 [Taxus chinensis]